MRRKLTEALLTWKKTSGRLPLLLTGTRQTGKTWLLLDFGKRYYRYILHFSLGSDLKLQEYLKKESNPAYLLEFLESYGGKPILPNDTLLILDDIQECPDAYSRLTALAEEYPGYSIVAAERFSRPFTSSETAGLPRLSLFPLDFEEFLWACREVSLAKKIREGFQTMQPLSNDIHLKAQRLFRAYLVTGGFPEVVDTYRKEHSFLQIRDLQKKIFTLDMEDITENAPEGSQACARSCYRSLPAQFKKDNPYFQYSLAQKGSTRRLMEKGITWLKEQNLVYSIYEVTEGPSHFRTYYRDVGLCTAMLGMPPFELLQMDPSRLLDKIIEQAACMAFFQKGYQPKCWGGKGKIQLPFLLTKEKFPGKRIVVEVKTDSHRKSRSLFMYRQFEKFHRAYRITGENFKIDETCIQIPYYSLYCID